MWISHNGARYLVTDAYLAGAMHIQYGGNQWTPPPYKPGAEYAQFNYGRKNEKEGAHDNIDLIPGEKADFYRESL